MKNRVLAFILAGMIVMSLPACADNNNKRSYKMSNVDYETPYQGNPYLPLWCACCADDLL